METLHPLSPISTSGNDAENRLVTVLINRTVPASEEKTFRSKLKDLLGEFDRFPGTSGSMVFRQEAAGGAEFSILQQFAGKAEHDAWVGSPGFSRWRSEVAPPKPTPGHVHRYSGMEAFFVSAQAPDAPPRWKMAVLLMIAVYPLSLVLSIWGAPALARLPVLAGTFLTSVLMVFLMTYVLVPILTKLFQCWLQPGKRRNG
jgi:uncharacterized protein